MPSTLTDDRNAAVISDLLRKGLVFPASAMLPADEIDAYDAAADLAEADEEYAREQAEQAMIEAAADAEMAKFRAEADAAADCDPWPTEADVESYLEEQAAMTDPEWERFRARTYPTPEEMDAYFAGLPAAADVAAGFAGANEADPF